MRETFSSNFNRGKMIVASAQTIRCSRIAFRRGAILGGCSSPIPIARVEAVGSAWVDHAVRGVARWLPTLMHEQAVV